MSEHEIDPFIEEVAGELKRPVRFDSSFESRVMSAIDPSIVSRDGQRKAGRTSPDNQHVGRFFSHVDGSICQRVLTFICAHCLHLSTVVGKIDLGP